MQFQQEKNLIYSLAAENPNIIMAPIIDPDKPDYIYKFFLNTGVAKNTWVYLHGFMIYGSLDPTPNCG